MDVVGLGWTHYRGKSPRCGGLLDGAGLLWMVFWWRVRDLNPGPTDYDSAALTAELTRQKARQCKERALGCQ